MSSVLYADHVNHVQTDDDDDHRILITACGLRVGYTPPSNRQKSPFGEHVTCLACLAEGEDPEWIHCALCGAWLRFTDSYSPYDDAICASCNHELLPNDPRTQPYRCNVPMCGESGVCAECRKRGAR